MWYFYHNETTINSSLPLHIHDAITTCTSMIVLSYLLLSFDLESGVGVKRESNFKKYINDLHTSCFFFYLPTSTTQDHPLSLGQSTSVPILLVLPTNYWDCTMSWLAYYSIRQVHVYKVLIVNILLLEPHLKIWSLFNIRFLYFSVFQCSFLAPSWWLFSFSCY